MTLPDPPPPLPDYVPSKAIKLARIQGVIAAIEDAHAKGRTNAIQADTDLTIWRAIMEDVRNA